MKKTKFTRRITRVLLSCLLLIAMSLPMVSAYAAELPESEGLEEQGYAEAVIKVKAEEGTLVSVEGEEGSPIPDRSAYTCTGDKEKDSFTVRITEPGDYSYSLTVGTNSYIVRITGLYEETEGGEKLSAKAAVMNPDGTKTDEPSWTPFGIGDIEGRPMGMILGFTAVFTAIGLVFILRRKEEKA